MNRPIFVLTLAAGTIALCLSAAKAQVRNCAPRALVLEKLEEHFSETRQSIGLAADDQVVEVFAAEEGTWTITVTRTDGLTCIVATGRSFENLAEVLPPRGAPT